jgi:hypothetical protein
MIRRSALVVLLVVLLVAPVLSVSATSIGLGGGLDPTGLLFVGALTETPIAEWIDLRAQMSIALNSDIAGLMLISGAVLVHHPIEQSLDPFLGAGAGVALTPRGYSLGFTVNGLAGVRIALFEPVIAFANVHYIARFSDAGLTAGPIYEAGFEFLF